MPESVHARLHAVTPLFMGQASGQEVDPVRPTAVKGALRFWWRALNWHRCREQNASDAEALHQLHAEEGILFGTAADGQSRQSLFMLRVIPEREQETPKITDWPDKKSASSYLGLGLFKLGEYKQREAHKEGYVFSLKARFHPSATTVQIEQFRDAVRALGWFGGLGGRARRGFGSLALDELDGESAEFSEGNDYVEALRAFLRKHSANSLPPFTAFNAGVRLAWTEPMNNARATQNKLGQYYKEYRGEDGAPCSENDKLAFGTPLKDKTDDRRASPLFMHVHPVGSKFVGLFLHVPAQFHPKGVELKGRAGRGNWRDTLEPVETFMEKHNGVAP